MSEYDWVNAKVACNSLTMTTDVALSDVDIVVDISIEWLVLLISEENVICSTKGDKMGMPCWTSLTKGFCLHPLLCMSRPFFSFFFARFCGY